MHPSKAKGDPKFQSSPNNPASPNVKPANICYVPTHGTPYSLPHARAISVDINGAVVDRRELVEITTESCSTLPGAQIMRMDGPSLASPSSSIESNLLHQVRGVESRLMKKIDDDNKAQTVVIDRKFVEIQSLLESVKTGIPPEERKRIADEINALKS